MGASRNVQLCFSACLDSIHVKLIWCAWSALQGWKNWPGLWRTGRLPREGQHNAHCSSSRCSMTLRSWAQRDDPSATTHLEVGTSIAQKLIQLTIRSRVVTGVEKLGPCLNVYIMRPHTQYCRLFKSQPPSVKQPQKRMAGSGLHSRAAL